MDRLCFLVSIDHDTHVTQAVRLLRVAKIENMLEATIIMLALARIFVQYQAMNP